MLGVVGSALRRAHGGSDAGRERVGIRVKDRLQHWPADLPPLLLVQRSITARGPGIGGGTGPGPDEAEQVRERGIHLDVVQAQALEGVQFVLVFGDQPGAERRPVVVTAAAQGCEPNRARFSPAIPVTRCRHGRPAVLARGIA